MHACCKYTKADFFCLCSTNTFIVEVTAHNCQSRVLPFPPYWGTWLFFLQGKMKEEGKTTWIPHICWLMILNRRENSFNIPLKWQHLVHLCVNARQSLKSNLKKTPTTTKQTKKCERMVKTYHSARYNTQKSTFEQDAQSTPKLTSHHVVELGFMKCCLRKSTREMHKGELSSPRQF